jgi:hypothetical protein
MSQRFQESSPICVPHDGLFIVVQARLDKILGFPCFGHLISSNHRTIMIYRHLGQCTMDLAV